MNLVKASIGLYANKIDYNFLKKAVYFNTNSY